MNASEQNRGMVQEPGSPAARTPGGPIVNYFTSPPAAVRYVANRPGGHEQVLEYLRTALRDELPVGCALDVGCGSGQSSLALLPYAHSVIGLDSSSAMLAQASLNPRIIYRKGHAEALPFRGE